MPSREPFLIFTRTLNELGIRYMVSGSVAAIFYGEPRMTNDVDIVLLLARDDPARIAGAFPEEDFYCPPLEVIRLENSREQRGHFNLIHHETGFKADVYLVTHDKLHLWGLARVRVADLDGERVAFAPPEYVMARKLQFYREGGAAKHLRDLQRMLAGLGEEWDRTAWEAIIREWGLEKEWAAVLDFNG